MATLSGAVQVRDALGRVAMFETLSCLDFMLDELRLLYDALMQFRLNL